MANVNQQVLRMHLDRKKIETTLGISSAHFDKITSQLLGKML